MKCPMYDSCTLKTGGCVASLPDNGCYWYRWFKDLIQKTDSPWKTGTPTEEGWYLVTNGDDDSASYDIGKWDGESFCHMEYLDSAYVVAWQKIDPYKEKKDGR